MEYRRLRRAGGCYFFTVVTESRRPLLIDHIDRLRAAFKWTMARRSFSIEAIVVLPDHLHTVWSLPAGDSDYSTRWMLIKRDFSSGVPDAAVRASQHRKREKGIWQRRFWEHCIRDEADYRRHVEYIHFNPVKHGHCASPDEWPYSSFRRLARIPRPA